MTREEALEIAKDEINYVKEFNSFRDKELKKVYYEYIYSISENHDIVLEIFVNSLLIRNSPLVIALSEVD